jgi:hypothetical protein
MYIGHAASCQACKPWPCAAGQALVGVWRRIRRTSGDA